MAGFVSDFNVDDTLNTTFDSISQTTGKTPGTVKNSFQDHDGAWARWLADNNGTKTLGGTSTAATVTLNQAFTAYGTGTGQIKDGERIAVTTGSACAGGTTININSIGAKKIMRQGGVAVEVGEWASGAILFLCYDAAADGASGAWIIYSGLQQQTGSATPTPTAGSGTFTSASATTRWTIIGRRVFVDGKLTVTTLGTAAGTFFVPAPFTNGGDAAHGGGIITSTGFGLSVFIAAGGTNINLLTAGGLTPGATCQFTISYDLD